MTGLNFVHVTSIKQIIFREIKVSTNSYLTKVQCERTLNMYFNRVGVILGKRNLDLQKQLCHHLVKSFLVFFVLFDVNATTIKSRVETGSLHFV